MEVIETKEKMNLYFELLKKPIFEVKDVNIYYNNVDSARSAIKRLMREGMVAKIRNNMYTCISGETRQPVANRFQIASSITPTSFVSCHTALEYYGVSDQVFYEVYVSSKTSFRDFDFDGYSYRYIATKFIEGVETPNFSGAISVSDPERTIIDCIKYMDKIAGFEETMQGIENIQMVQENKLLKYLKQYHSQFLYQKTGFLLFPYKEKLKLSDGFFDFCEGQIGKSKRYLTNDILSGKYDNKWKLVIPKNLFIKNGVIDNATI